MEEAVDLETGKDDMETQARLLVPLLTFITLVRSNEGILGETILVLGQHKDPTDDDEDIMIINVW
jgi:hypothetical protein